MSSRTSIPTRYRNLFFLSAVVLLAFLFIAASRPTFNVSAALGFSVTDNELEISPDSRPFPNPWLSLKKTHGARTNETYPNIPNIFNFVYVVREGVQDLNFEFKEVLAFYAAWLYSDPDVIYLHTNAAPEAIERARSGRRGKWNALILTIPQLVVNFVEEPKYAGNGVKITLMPHKSDFVRAAAVDEFGGVYIDTDAIPLRDLRPLMGTGFKAVIGRQLNGEIASGHFMGEPHSLFVRRWREDMNMVYDQGWVTHAVLSMTRIAREVATKEKELLIMDTSAWNQVHWNPVNPAGGTQNFYTVHTDVRSNLDGVPQGGELPEFGSFADQVREGGVPKWQRDYSEAYILHSWHEKRGATLRKPFGFDRVTPRYVLERRSDFARAVYPIAKSLYDNRLIALDDPWRYVVSR